MIRVLRFLEHPPIELKPGNLAIHVSVGRQLRQTLHRLGRGGDLRFGGLFQKHFDVGRAIGRLAVFRLAMGSKIGLRLAGLGSWRLVRGTRLVHAGCGSVRSRLVRHRYFAFSCPSSNLRR